MEQLWEIYGMRKYLELTQKEYADLLGFSRSSINDIENMRRIPSIALLIAFDEKLRTKKTDEFYLFLLNLKKIVSKYPI